MEKYRNHVESFTVKQLHEIRTCLGFEFKKGNKDELVSATLEFLSGLDRSEHAREWFTSLPSYLSRAIETATFKGYIDAEQVEIIAGKPVTTGSRFYHYDFLEINSDLRLGIFDLYRTRDRTLLFMKPLFRRLLAPVLPLPASYTIRPSAEQELTGWSAAEALSESMPLLLRSIEQFLADPDNHEKILRRGLNKGDIRELRKSSAFPAFPVVPPGGRTGIDPIDLLVRFLMIDPRRVANVNQTDVRDFIKDLVTTFFVVPPSGQITSYYLLVDSSFEFSVLCPHMSKGRGGRQHHSLFNLHPPARSIFFQILKKMAGSRGWYDVEQAVESIRMQALSFTIFRDDVSAAECIVKGEELVLPEHTIRIDPWEKGFVPDIYLAHDLLTRPLLKAYCYLMASLGLLEIESAEPEKRLIKNGKGSPISPFEGLRRVRVTPFGAWCLGVSEEKPELQQVRYEAIADRDLPLVTYRGRSLECKVFLERIGDPIGEDRFRIGEASFIRDCRTAADIDDRIGEFRRLIARDPADHWESLFSRVRERAVLFDREEPCVMIQLPEERTLRRLFLEEKRISSLVVRAEGGRIVVAQRNYKKLRKILEEYGVLKG